VSAFVRKASPSFRDCRAFVADVAPAEYAGCPDVDFTSGSFFQYQRVLFVSRMGEEIAVSFSLLAGGGEISR
jgi:hypothetical protein